MQRSWVPTHITHQSYVGHSSLAVMVLTTTYHALPHGALSHGISVVVLCLLVLVILCSFDDTISRW